MAKVASHITSSPLRFVAGFLVYDQDLRDVIEAANFAAVYTLEHHGGGFGAEVGWNSAGAGVEPSGLKILIDGTLNTYVTRARWRIDLDNEVTDLQAYYEFLVFGADTCNARILMDGTPVMTSGNANGAQTLTATVSGVTAGRHTLELQVRRTAGALLTHQLVSWDVVELAINPAALPDPTIL